jgi:hypothetical protein
MARYKGLMQASEALRVAAIGAGTDCDPLADIVNSIVIELVEAVRKGLPDSTIKEKTDTLFYNTVELLRCLRRIKLLA